MHNTRVEPVGPSAAEAQKAGRTSTMKRFYCVMTATLLLPVFSAAQTPRQDGHPDLSGIWAYTIGLPATGVKRVVNASARFERVDRGVVGKSEVPGALPPAPP